MSDMRTLNELRVIQLEAKQKERKERLSEVAPEMLEMLKILRSYIGNRGTFSGYMPFKPWNDLQILIAEAEGGE